jgi:hypothetical protein
MRALTRTGEKQSAGACPFLPLVRFLIVSHGFHSRVKTKPLRRRAGLRLGLDLPVRLVLYRSCRERAAGRRWYTMATYKIIRIYEVPGEDQIEATNRMMEALMLRVERHYHVMDYVKSPEDGPNKGKKVILDPPKGWLATFMDQLLGRSEKNKA